MQRLDFSKFAFIRLHDENGPRQLLLVQLMGLNLAVASACSGVPFGNCQAATQGGASFESPCGVGGNPQAGAGGTTQANTLPSGGQSSAQSSLIPNGSFELDEQASTSPASAPPSGWTMLSSASTGNLLHALRSNAMAIPMAAAQGQNVAAFDSLTASSYREAISMCFPIQSGQSARVTYQVMVPQSQNATGTRSAVKIWYFQDAGCLAPSATRVADTQTAASNSAAGVWETKPYVPSQPTPADATAARISIRAAYNAGTGCGSLGVACAEDKIYFDAIGFEQSK